MFALPRRRAGDSAGEDRAEPGDYALILGDTEVISKVERMVTDGATRLGSVVIAVGRESGTAVAAAVAAIFWSPSGDLY